MCPLGNFLKNRAKESLITIRLYSDHLKIVDQESNTRVFVSVFSALQPAALLLTPVVVVAARGASGRENWTKETNKQCCFCFCASASELGSECIVINCCTLLRFRCKPFLNTDRWTVAFIHNVIWRGWLYVSGFHRGKVKMRLGWCTSFGETKFDFPFPSYSPTKDVRPGLLHNRHQQRSHEIYKKKQEHDAQAREKQKPVRIVEAERREEGLQEALGSDNKGFALLQKMGYKPGTAIGKSGKVEHVSWWLTCQRRVFS